MIKTINELNNTLEFTFESILYGGSSTSYDPANVLDDSVVNSASKEVYETLRKHNQFNGIYFALGPYDLFTPNYQDFTSAQN